MTFISGTCVVSHGPDFRKNLITNLRFTDDSHKVRFAQTHRTIRAGWFSQQGMIRASRLLCCVFFKLRFNDFIYLIYQLFVWALLVADVNLGYMHLSTKYYTL